MTRKLAIVFAVLALSSIANATADSNSPASVFAVTPGKLFTNGTDTAFTSLKGPCMFTGGFDNTTNYVWCLTASASSTVPYTFQRRAINASSPATTNSTADTKLASSHYAQTNGIAFCSGAGYFGFATGYGTGTSPTYKSDVSFSFAAVNASSFTKVALTSNSDANMINEAQACMYDNGIFYIIYTSYHYCQAGTEGGSCTSNKTQNAVYIQGVNVTSGAVYYNSTGGVKLWSPTSQVISGYSGTTLSFSGFVGNNQTGYATQGLLLYTDASTSTAPKYNLLPVTLSTGAAGSVQTLATGATSTVTAASSSTFSSTATTYHSTSVSQAVITSTYLTSLVQQFGASQSEISVTNAASTYTTGTVISDGATSYLTTVVAVGSTWTVSSTTSTSTSTATSTYTSTYYSTTSTEKNSAQVIATLTSTVSTVYGMSAFGSLSTYGVVLTQDVDSSSLQMSANDHSHTYSNSLFINGSTTASTAANLTNPSGYYLDSVSGFATTDGGYCLIETFASTTSGSASAVYKDTYYYNGTQTTTSVSLGTYQSDVEPFADATGSIWLGYTVNDDSNNTLPLVSAYAGEVLYQNLSASVLSSIFATLAIMIAALFAF